jgi:large subunit ribosomal protein L25
MAEIILNVEVRDRIGTGAARAARNAGLVPGILYGADKAPVPIAVKAGEFRKALHTGKLLGHLVTLQYGEEQQAVIAKDVQFDPVDDEPVHFDLFRVDTHASIRISVPVRFHNQDICPGLKRGGSLNIDHHEIEVMAPADAIPEEIVVDLSNVDVGGTIRTSDLTLPDRVQVHIHHRDATIASIGGSKTMAVDEAEEADA